MRPRNVLTETNNMRRLMGLPLLNEDTGDSIKDIKKKVLNESTIEYENDQWLVIDKEENKKEDKKGVNENAPAFSLGFAKAGGLSIDEETDSITEIEKAQKMAEERELKAKELNIKSNKYPMEDNLTEQDPDFGEGPDIGGGLEPLDQVVAEDSSSEDVWGFSQYNITLLEQEEVGGNNIEIAEKIIDATVGSLARGEITKYLDAITAGVWGAGTDEESLYEALKQLSPQNIAGVGKELDKLIGHTSRTQFDIGSGLGNAFDRLLRGELSEEEYNKAVSILKGNGLKPEQLRRPRGEDHDDSHYIWWVPASYERPRGNLGHTGLERKAGTYVSK